MKKLTPRLLSVALLFTLLATPLRARARFQGYAERGGQTVITALTGTSVKGMVSYPFAQYTVLNSGTSTPATVYSDLTGTPKICPCTTDSTAFLFFYGDSASYDVRFSGAGIAIPWTQVAFGSTGGSAISTVVFAPPPSGGDDFATIQALITANNPLSAEVHLLSGAYRISAELHPASGFPLRLSGNGFVYQSSGGGGTVIQLTQTARSVVAVTEKYGYIRGILLDANRLGTYGVFVGSPGGGTAHRFIDGRTTNAILDGIHCDGVALNQGLSTSYWSSDANGKTYATAGILAQYPSSLMRQPVIAGTAAVVSGGTTITITGGPNITTLGIRGGDLVRVGPVAATSFYGQIESVAHIGAGNDTITLQPLITPKTTASGLDFAIGIGWGWFEEPNGGNGYNMLADVSFFRGNGCGGVLDGGLYGNHVKDSFSDFNNFTGRSMGKAFNLGSLFEPVSEGVYMEGNLGPDYIIGNTVGAKIDSPGGGSALDRVDSGAGSQGVIIHGSTVESIVQGITQNFVVEVRNNAGTIQHRIVSEHYLSFGPIEANKIIGNSTNWTNTPTVNNVTDFATGVGLYDAGGVMELLLNTSAVVIAGNVPGATVEFNSTGTTYLAHATVPSINVNGTSKNRLAIFVNDMSGNIVPVNTVTLAAGKSIGVRLAGYIR